MQARQLVSDTFVRLTVWRKGIRPGLTPGECRLTVWTERGKVIDLPCTVDA